jgi:hypothetical protein
LLRKYGITREEFNKLLIDQWGLCAICGKGENMVGGRYGTTPVVLAVDHDRQTGKIRGLLCHSCNTHVMRNEVEVRMRERRS